jgi:Spy/CpxP family protein refolding chaperone
MRYLFPTLALVAVIAAATGFLAFRASGNGAVQDALSRRDAMEWLRTDFQLTNAQFARIKKMHEAYSTVCEEHCREIQIAARARRALEHSAPADPAAIAAADRRVEQLRLVCESAIATHVRQCAAQMSPEAGQRYLAMVLPKIKDFDHQAAPDLQVSHSRH